MKNFFKNLGIFLLTIIITIIVIAVFWIIGFLVQYFIWFLCTIWDIFKGSNPVIEWIYSHDLTVHIICSLVSFFILILNFLYPGNSNTHIKTTKIVDSSDSSNYDNTISNSNYKRIQYVDCSGNYRYFGENFIDHTGNWCTWGTGFYDYDDNYIHWGEKYRDSSGNYRQWGESFVDAAGNYIHIP